MVGWAALQQSHIKKYYFYKEITQFRQLRDTVVIIILPAKSRGDSEDNHDRSMRSAKLNYAADGKM